VRFAVASASGTTDVAGKPAVALELSDLDEQRFYEWTAANVDRKLAILVDRRVCVMATIATPLKGSVVLTGGHDGFSTEDVHRMVRDWNPAH